MYIYIDIYCTYVYICIYYIYMDIDNEIPRLPSSLWLPYAISVSRPGCHRFLTHGTVPWINLESWSIHRWLTKKKQTRWKPRTRMYSRSWTTSENLCNRNTNLFFHTSCAHIVSAKAPHQQFTKRQLTHKETHNKNRWFCNSTTKSPVQRNHQHNEITSTTKSPAQQHHQHNEITSEQHQRNKITSTNEITSTTKSPAKRNHQHNNISSTTRSPPAAQQHHQHNNITSAMKSQQNHQRNTTKSPEQRKHQRSRQMQNRIKLRTIGAEGQLQKPDFDIQAPKMQFCNVL